MGYYKDFNFKSLFTRKYSHIFLLLFWPIHGALFYLYERVIPLKFHAVECSLDSLIPFNEYMIVPYYLWYAYMIGIMVYWLFRDVNEFRMYMNFIIIGYLLTLLFYLIYPTEQNLRPTEFERDNIFVDMVRDLYITDTNTNVCPSLHVIGQMAAFFGAWRVKVKANLTVLWRVFWIISTLAVCASTVNLKQHSIIDVFAGLAVSVLMYFVAYKWLPMLAKRKEAPITEPKKELAAVK